MAETPKPAALTREDILLSALEAREQEVMHYQINIDNYTLALAHIAAMDEADRADLAPFVKQLTTLLASEKLEQKKARVMLDVVRAQVESSHMVASVVFPAQVETANITQALQ